MVERQTNNEKPNFSAGLEKVADGEVVEWRGLNPSDVNYLEAAIFRSTFNEKHIDPDVKDWRIQSPRVSSTIFDQGKLGEFCKPAGSKAAAQRTFVVIAGPFQQQLTRLKSPPGEHETGITLWVKQSLPVTDQQTIHFVTYYGLKGPVGEKNDGSHQVRRVITAVEDPFSSMQEKNPDIKLPKFLQLIQSQSGEYQK